jgi:hypothetical protein
MQRHGARDKVAVQSRLGTVGRKPAETVIGLHTQVHGAAWGA